MRGKASALLCFRIRANAALPTLGLWVLACNDERISAVNSEETESSNAHLIQMRYFVQSITSEAFIICWHISPSHHNIRFKMLFVLHRICIDTMRGLHEAAILRAGTSIKSCKPAMEVCGTMPSGEVADMEALNLASFVSFLQDEATPRKMLLAKETFESRDHQSTCRS